MIKSAYIHIPFCEHLCSYCDFCKQLYNKKNIFSYLETLEKEIKLKYRGESLETIYIGGGTPSCLDENELEKLLKIVKSLNFSNNYEFTVEVNPENITWNKLLLLKKYGVNRISMGVESTNEKYLNYLNRFHNFDLVKEKISLMKKVGIKNINIDLIYAIPGESISDLELDLENILSLDVTHISTYSLMINEHTTLGIQEEETISDELDFSMYELICKRLKEKGFIHYEISNFSKEGYYSCHNLTYWHNNEYYGFGLGSSGYIDNIRYENTRSLKKYLDGKYVLNKEKLDKREKIIYELILGFRLIDGINKKEFEEKYNLKLVDQANIRELINEGHLVDDGLNIKVSYDKIYVENSILVNFV